jgi:hypothetical protein
MAFALYDLIDEAQRNGYKVNNFVLAKQVGFEVEQCNTEEESGYRCHKRGSKRYLSELNLYKIRLLFV